MMNPVFHYLSAIVFLLLGVYFYFNSTVPAIAIVFVVLMVFQLFLARAIKNFRLQLMEKQNNTHEQ